MFILKHKDNILTTENFKNQLEQINLKKTMKGDITKFTPHQGPALKVNP